jgi:hypothetical protein
MEATASVRPSQDVRRNAVNSFHNPHRSYAIRSQEVIPQRRTEGSWSRFATVGVYWDMATSIACRGALGSAIGLGKARF